MRIQAKGQARGLDELQLKAECRDDRELLSLAFKLVSERGFATFVLAASVYLDEVNMKEGRRRKS